MANPEADRQRSVVDAMARFDSFCGLLQVRPKSGSGTADDGKRIRVVLTPLQLRYNRSRTGRDIVLKPRQVFFTTLEAARDVWWFLVKPGAHVRVVCQSQTDQAALKDISEKFRIYFDSLRRLGVKLEFGRETGTEWTLPKRDSSLRIIQAGASQVAAQRKGRGGTVSRLHLSEMAFWGDYAQDTFGSIAESVPMTGSEIVNESTANGAAGFFYDQWNAAVEGKSAYQPYFVAWYDHHEYSTPLDPGEAFSARDDRELALLDNGVAPAQLKWRRQKVADKGGNEDLVAQDYPNDPRTCFLVEGRGFFDGKKIDQQILEAKTPEEVDAFTRIWERPKAGSEYVIAADPSEGDPDNDPSAAAVIERGTGKLVAAIHGFLRSPEFALRLAALGILYNTASIAVERNNHGHAVLLFLEREKYPKIYAQAQSEGGQKTSKLGWLTNEQTRAMMLDELDRAHRKDEFAPPDADTLGEMRTFVIGKDGKAQAKSGAHDDRVMCVAIAWAVASRPTGFSGDLPAPNPLVSPMGGW